MATVVVGEVVGQVVDNGVEGEVGVVVVNHNKEELQYQEVRKIPLNLLQQRDHT